MFAEKYEYTVPQQLTIQSIKAKLHEQLRCHELSKLSLERTFYDSFDWRLYNNAYFLETEAGPTQAAKLSLYSGKKKLLSCAISPQYRPGFSWGLPTDLLQQRLQAILETRTLLPIVVLHCTRHHLSIVNNEQKTTVRIVLEEYSIDSKMEQQLPSRLQITAIKGYSKAFAQVRRLLEHDLQITAAENDLLTAALALEQRSPGDYSGKFTLLLDPASRAQIALKQILLYLLEMIEINETGSKANLDSEFLHDFRVAIRRTRSAISQIKKVLPGSVQDHYRSEFAWLASITSPTRDLDVYLLHYLDYHDSLPVTMQEHLVPLHDFLQQQQKIEQKKLRKQLQSKRYQNLLKTWREFLQSPTQTDPAATQAILPIKQLADQRIWRVYRRVIRDGSVIKPDIPVEALHELRKTCKKLRYLMEFFHSLYAPKKIKKLIGYLKVLQNNLGDVQDFAVQAETLKRFAGQMLQSNNVTPDTLMAIGALAANLETRQQQARDVFAERFAAFSTAANQSCFKALFKNQLIEEN